MKRSLEIKVCGMRDPENIRQVAALGVDALGFIFVRDSARFVDSRLTATVLDDAAPGLKRVGVFANAMDREIASRVQALKLSAVQLHGDETPETTAIIRDSLPSVEVWKAIRVAGDESLTLIEQFRPCCDRFVFDTADDEDLGGTGKMFDWTVLARADVRHPFLLAGGIGPHNARIAVTLFRGNQFFRGIDINSVVETAAAVKSPALVAQVVQEVESELAE